MAPTENVCDTRWLVDTNRRLAEFDADYVVHQIKERFGPCAITAHALVKTPTQSFWTPCMPSLTMPNGSPRRLANAVANPGCCREPGTGPKRCAIRAPEYSATHRHIHV